MRALGNVTAALKIMRSSRTRSLFYHMLGVIIAVAAVTTVVVSIGDGVKQHLLQANKSGQKCLNHPAGQPVRIHPMVLTK